MARRCYRPVASAAMQALLEAIQQGAPGEEIAAIPLPESYRATVVLESEQTMFEGLDSADKDPRKSLHVQEVATRIRTQRCAQWC